MITLGALARLQGIRICTKVRHKSEGAAMAHLRSMRRSPRVRDVDRLSPYRCIECSRRYGADVFHIGHPRKSESIQK